MQPLFRAFRGPGAAPQAGIKPAFGPETDAMNFRLRTLEAFQRWIHGKDARVQCGCNAGEALVEVE